MVYFRFIRSHRTHVLRRNFGCLESGDYVPFVRVISGMASELSFNQMCKYWGIMGLRMLFVPKSVIGERQRQMKAAVHTVQKRVENGSTHKDFLHYILSANAEKGMSPEEIYVNAFSLSIAGSESTATALSGILFLVLTHQKVYDQLIEAIRTAHDSEKDITLLSTNRLEYLDAVITEGLRIYPPVAITMPRQTQINTDGGQCIGENLVPAGTTVGVNHFIATHHPDNFYQPESFLPNRWMSEFRDKAPFDQDDKESAQPFSFGPRNCLGKNIAKAELRLLLVKLFYRFDWQLQDGQGDWLQQKVQGFWQKKPLYCTISLAKY